MPHSLVPRTHSLVPKYYNEAWLQGDSGIVSRVGPSKTMHVILVGHMFQKKIIPKTR